MRPLISDSIASFDEPLHELVVSAPRQARAPTSFLKDCSLQSPESSSSECRRLRELFQGKDVIGKEIKDADCEAHHPYPDPRGYKRDKRLEYFHDTSTDLWYKCCEYRGRYQDFASRDPYPRFPENTGLKATWERLNATLFGRAVDLNGIPNDAAEPSKGPFLECNMMENLKHREDTKPERLITGTNPEGKSLFSKRTECQGHQAVPLQRYAGGAKYRSSSGKEVSQCIDTGTPGASTPGGKKYHVFRLSLPDPRLLALTDPDLDWLSQDRPHQCKTQPETSPSRLARFL